MPCLVGAALCGVLIAADPNEAISDQLVALERKAMDGWQVGNPDPTLAIADPGITYFHVVTEKRVDGLRALKTLFAGYRGRPLFDSYEIVEPKVQVTGDVAVLTYILVQHQGMQTARWNATQIYQHKDEGWRVIHSHWSVTRPAQP